VWGVLYDIPDYLIKRNTSGSRKSLDAIEGALYERREISVVDENDATIDDVVTYTVKEPHPGLRTELEYVRHILRGLRNHDASGEYIHHVKERIVGNNPDLAKYIIRA
jgi:hypothetical protein